MATRTAARRRPTAPITLARAARLHRLVAYLAGGPRSRTEILEAVGLGLRTFYREQGLLRRCGIRIRQASGSYRLAQSMAEAEGFLPVPDPLLSLAELAELSQGEGVAAKRMAGLLERVTAPPDAPEPGRSKGKGKA
ncbi:MAG: hypothetical protein U0800_02330 [Isosphaeraceae bacterium]